MTPTLTPFSSAAAMIRSHFSSVTSSGFSIRQCLPAAIQANAGSWCAPDGVQMQTISTAGSASIASRLSNALQFSLSANASLFCGVVLNTPTSSACWISRIARACTCAIIPAPTIPNPYFFSIRLLFLYIQR